MIEINLIPDVKQELIRAQRQRALVISASVITGIAALGVVVLLAIYIFGIQAVRFAVAEDNIQKGSEQLASIEDLPKVLTIQNQLNQISALNETKKAESRIFDMLKSVVPPAPNQVQIASITVDAEQKLISLEGQTPAYDSVEVFKKTLEGAMVTYGSDGESTADPLATNISLTDVSFGEDSSGAKVVRFMLSFTYPESLLDANIAEIVIKLTNIGNVTDSYLGVPRSIFVEEGEQ
ncbi:hypothetical protein B7Y94_00275 [Candidatus Saccharibacteria bacterium 32-49-12]|nr:MAG: hypothetical protein B7Y94_00275 [Candidatus Saccharibacteria bacterium 32-49-12]